MSKPSWWKKAVVCKIDKEFIAYMQARDEKKARQYRRDIDIEEGDNYSSMMISYNKEDKRWRLQI